MSLGMTRDLVAPASRLASADLQILARMDNGPLRRSIVVSAEAFKDVAARSDLKAWVRVLHLGRA